MHRHWQVISKSVLFPIDPIRIDWSLDAIPDSFLSTDSFGMLAERLFFVEGVRIQP